MRRDLLHLRDENELSRCPVGLGVPLVLALTLLVLSGPACDFSANLAATALAPTPVPPPGTLVAGGSVVQSGDQMAGILRQAGEEHRYTFHGEAGQAVTIEMQAGPGGNLDSYLELRAPDGSTLTYDDDSGGSLNSRIANFVLPQTGEYVILAYGFSHTSTGAYGLTMILGTPAPSPTPPPTPEMGGGVLAIGDTVTGEFVNIAQMDLWIFEAAAGDIVSVEMRALDLSNPIDSFLELIDPGGTTLAVNDDGGGGRNAYIANQMLPLDGLYTIRATALGGGRGRYQLTLTEGQPPTPTFPPPTLGPTPTPYDREIAPGESVEDIVYPRTVGNRYFFQIDEPLMLEILVSGRAENQSLYAELRDSSGTLVQNLSGNSDSSTDVYLLQTLALQTPGQYQIRLFGYGDYPIPYTLTLSPGEPLRVSGGEIHYGQGVSGELLAVGQHELWTFEGRAGDIVTIIMNGVNMDSYLELHAPDGARLASDDDGNGALDSRISAYPLPQDGTYTIVARSLNNSGYGPYRLLLSLDSRAVAP